MTSNQRKDLLVGLLLVALLAAAGISCGGSGEGLTSSGDAGTGFSRQIQPLFDANCVRCHSPGGVGYLETGGGSDNGLLLTAGNSHARLVDQATFEEPAVSPRWRVLPGEPDSSYLLQKVTSGSPKNGRRMPLDGPPYLTASEIEVIRVWIEDGAKDD